MKTRLADNDRNFGPLTIATANSTWYHITLERSGPEHDEDDHCRINVWVGKLLLRLSLPKFIKRSHKYGVSLYGNHLSVYYGFNNEFASHTDGKANSHWSCFLPWNEWNLVRRRLYDDKMEMYSACNRYSFYDENKMLCPKVKFYIRDYDGVEIVATTHIEELEWARGKKPFRWLRWFVKNKVRRSLEIWFDQELGSEKGSWKGGTLGHGITMLPGEDHETAFKRYCAQGHRGKYKTTPITYIGKFNETITT